VSRTRASGPLRLDAGPGHLPTGEGGCVNTGRFAFGYELQFGADSPAVRSSGDLLDSRRSRRVANRAGSPNMDPAAALRDADRLLIGEQHLPPLASEPRSAPTRP
jgi:hypothetical protein